jgi:hypothetical protein
MYIMSKDLIKSATIKANKAELNYINFKGDEIGNTIQPELVKRTSLHPTVNEKGEVEDRVYYTLHNDAGDCVYVSPFIQEEISNNISKTIIPGDNPPPPPPPPPGEEEDEEIIPPNWYNTDFDDYAELLVTKLWPGYIPPGLKTTRKVTGWYEDTSLMQTARRAMKNTRDISKNRGLEVDMIHPNLMAAEEMFAGSHVEELKLEVPNLIFGNHLAYTCLHLKESELAECKELTSLKCGYRNCNILTEVEMPKSESLLYADATFRNCKALRNVTIGTESITSMDEIFYGAGNPRIITKGPGKKKPGAIAFPKAEWAERAWSFSDVTVMDTVYFESLLSSTEMFKGCKLLTYINDFFVPEVRKAKDMFMGCEALREAYVRFDALQDRDGNMYDDSGNLLGNVCDNRIGISPHDPIDTPKGILVNEPVYTTNAAPGMFGGCDKLEIAGCSFPSLIDASGLYKDLPVLRCAQPEKDGFEKAENISSLFENCPSLTHIFGREDAKPAAVLVNGNAVDAANTLINLPEIKAGKMTNFLSGCTALEYIALAFAEDIGTDLTKELQNAKGSLDYAVLDLRACTNLSNLFKDFSRLSYARLLACSATNLTSLFENCVTLQKVNGYVGPKDSDLAYRHFNNAILCDKMFKDTRLLQQIDLGYMENVTNAAEMFKNSGIRWINGKIGITTTDTAIDMFRGCTRLQKAFATFPKLVNGTELFKNCYGLKVVSSKTMYMTGYEKCPYSSIPTAYDLKLISHGAQFPVLTDGTGMFSGCSSLVVPPITPNLTNGERMYENCCDLTSIPTNLTLLENGRYMFGGSGVTKIVDQYNFLTNAEAMFRMSKIQEADLRKCPNIVNPRFMFNNCSKLKKLNMYLPNATDVTSFIGNIYDDIEIEDAVLGPKVRGQMTNVTPFSSNNIIKILKAVGSSGNPANSAGSEGTGSSEPSDGYKAARIEISAKEYTKKQIETMFGTDPENPVEHTDDSGYSYSTWTEKIMVIDPNGIPNQERMMVHYDNGGSVKLFWIY